MVFAAVIRIRTNHPFLGTNLENDIPEGVNVKRPPVEFQRALPYGDPVTASFEIEIFIDAAEVVWATVAAWLMVKLRTSRQADVEVNGSPLPEDDSEAEKLIAKCIRNEQENDRDR